MFSDLHNICMCVCVSLCLHCVATVSPLCRHCAATVSPLCLHCVVTVSPLKLVTCLFRIHLPYNDSGRRSNSETFNMHVTMIFLSVFTAFLRIVYKAETCSCLKIHIFFRGHIYFVSCLSALWHEQQTELRHPDSKLLPVIWIEFSYRIWS